MPLFKASLRFAHDATWPQRRKWSNTFYFNVANVDTAAAALVVAWTGLLRSAVYANVFAYEVYASDLTPGTDVYTVQPIPVGQQRGSIAVPDGEFYLLKACIRVPLSVAGSRPSFKFWRPGLKEATVVNGEGIDGTLRTTITTAFTNFIDESGGGLVDPDSEPVTGVQNLRLTTREFGRTAGNDLPIPPAVG